MTSANMLTVYGSKVSYFTGKLEAYLRYKQIPYRFQTMTSEYFSRIIPEKTGAQQMPAVELADGRWGTDTTPLIAWFEREHPEHPIIPADPQQAFVAHLIEDYADEWLWRPAMHFRWSYYTGRQLLGTILVDELGRDLKMPTWLMRWQIRRRQKTHFVDRDGVTPANRQHVEQAYLTILELLETVFQDRPFIFGARPTLADFGLCGPLFRHFSQDPTPAEIMRETAPAVFEWVARLWNARASRLSGTLVEGIPADLLPLLREIGETHLPNLVENAQAWRRGSKRYDVTIQGVQYRDLPVSQYRSWCLEQLQQRFRQLPEQTRDSLQILLEQQGCWQPLWAVDAPQSGYDPERRAPFGVGLEVYPIPGH